MFNTSDRLSAKLKVEWTAALRSGKVAQAVGVLVDHDGTMCCLGVLCSIVQPIGWDDIEDLGTTDISPVYDGLSEETCTRLGNMNDGTGGQLHHTFSQIADWIEANIEGK